MPVPDLIVGRNRHLRFASFSYRALSPGHIVLFSRRAKKRAQPQTPRVYIADIDVSDRGRAFPTRVR